MKTTSINPKSIIQLDKEIVDERFVCIGIESDDDMFFIKEDNYDGNLNAAFEKLLEYRKIKPFAVIKTVLVDGDPNISVILEEGQ